MKFSFVAKGCIAVHCPDYPGMNSRGYVLWARVVMELHLGRFLRTDENVHHINGDSCDHRLLHLEVLTRSEHTKRHWEDGTLADKVKKLDYDEVERLMFQGLGYKRIAKKLGESVDTVKSACRVIRRTAVAL